jgi:hypothetical protein
LLDHTSGSCPALTWDGKRYQCGLVIQPRQHLQWLPELATGLARRLALRWIGTGVGCDFDVELED